MPKQKDPDPDMFGSGSFCFVKLDVLLEVTLAAKISAHDRCGYRLRRAALETAANQNRYAKCESEEEAGGDEVIAVEG
jgi:hypothetical protein